MPQTVTVMATVDNDSGGGTRTLMHTVSDYEGVPTAASVTVMVTDNDAPTVSITDDIAMGTPVTRTEDIAGTVDIKVTFTFVFSEPVSDFVRDDDITVVGGGTLGTLTGTAGTRTYTLDVDLPTTPTNNGIMTVTVAAPYGIRRRHNEYRRGHRHAEVRHAGTDRHAHYQPG